MASHYATATAQYHSRQQSVTSLGGGLLAMSASASAINGMARDESPLPSVADSDAADTINLQIFVPELQIQKCLTVSLEETIWDIKRKLFASLTQALPQSFNFGLFLPPCGSRAGKFLLEDRPIKDYPFHDCVPYLELKYKKRVYKMLKLDEKALKQMHSKSNLKKFMDYVQNKNADKVEKWCTQGMDANFHDPQGETPLTLAAGISNNRNVLIALIGGGAHLDFRNSEGQTGMHKAAFLSMAENVKTLLELGASPNYRDPIGLTPLYYSMLTTDSSDTVVEMLLSEAAEVGIVDMHGNHELHQACKNGLMKHLEHLLYYGADINAQNVNGNTPLHVCAVNNRPECAKVLLFRGADASAQNKQGQTALQVAYIVSHSAVADVIQTHNPAQSVPYRGTPKYNTRRRLTNPILRRRSLSQSSICSAQSDRYQAPQNLRQMPPQMGMPSPSPSCMTMCPSNTSEYGTLRRFAPDIVEAQPRAGFEPNVPRILVIPRGPKGFGFILRGAKHIDSEMEFEPTPICPALQFFEGVDMSGMSMKAGLRPGDFLLEINGVDVTCATHEQVVHLIHQSDDTITLKVITVDAPTSNGTLGHYASVNGTVQNRRNHSVPRNGNFPPMPPQRHPSTSLSYARAGPMQHAMGFSMDDSSSPSTTLNSNYNYLNQTNALSNSNHSNSKSMEYLNHSNNSDVRCASVKSRPTASRRISAAELEHLMIRQGTSTASQFQPIPYEQESPVNGQPKKYTSVAEMKRRKQRGMPSPSMNPGNPGPVPGLHRSNQENENYYQMNALHPQHPQYHQHQQQLQQQQYHQQQQQQQMQQHHQGHHQGQNQMKSFNSSPDLQQHHQRKPSIDSINMEYSRPNRSALRPKTPPPPPPEKIYGAARKQESNYGAATAPPPPPPPPPAATTATKAPPPPPPPPPPSNFLKSNGSALKPVDAAEKKDNNGGDCRGITAQALTAVKLKSVSSPPPPAINNNNNVLKSAMSKPPPPVGPKKCLDFDQDLRNALAKRRSKVGTDEDDTSKNVETNTVKEEAVVGRYNGLSLRESVRENVQQPPKNVGNKLLQHSPPGFVNKKDSGYTSSRTSLEPSECGDEINSGSNETTSSNASSTTIRIPDQSEGHRVTLISQQLEDTYGTIQQRKVVQSHQHDTVSISSTTSSASDNMRSSLTNQTITNVMIPDLASSIPYNRPLYLEPKMRTPPVDYEDPDSGTGDSDHDDRSASSSAANSTTTGSSVTESVAHFKTTTIIDFRDKELRHWTLTDVVEWLEYLSLQEYTHKFVEHSISGADLIKFDRIRFTQLGITRISHRQSMEQSLRSFSSG